MWFGNSLKLIVEEEHVIEKSAKKIQLLNSNNIPKKFSGENIYLTVLTIAKK